MLAINGRFIARRVTGVERYAIEIATRITAKTEVIKPKRASNGLMGHFWEQVVLPIRAGNRPLWSPCNSGPVTYQRQIVTFHDCCVLDHPEWFSDEYYKFYSILWPRLAKRATKIITVSAHAKRRIIEQLRVPDKKVEVIANGVGKQFSPSEPKDILNMRTRLGIGSGPYVLSLCSIEPRKNLSTLLACWKTVATKHPELSLILAGGPGKSTVFRGNPKDIQAQKSVIYTGYVDEQYLSALYTGATCFVYPSLYEGFGLPVLEAFACGVPVVTANTTSLPEIAGPGRLVDPSSQSEIAKAIIEIIEEAPVQRDRLLRISHAANFTWEACAKRTEQVLSAVM